MTTLQSLALPGDALLYRVNAGSAVISKAIATGELWGSFGLTNEQYSHVAINEDGANKLEAWFPVFRRAPIDWTDAGLELWRVKAATPTQIEEAIQNMRWKIGDPYDFMFGLVPLPQVIARHFEDCSQAYNDAFTQAGYPLDGKDKVVSPDDIIASGLLVQITE